MAHVEGIFISAQQIAPMQSLEVATLIPGVGIKGDRYALGTGTFCANFLWEPGRNLTMLSADSVEAAMAKSGMDPVPLGDFRRNITVRGLSADELNDMIGHEVTVGSCRVFVHRRTVPCKYREGQIKRPGLCNKLWDVCGVNCEILTGGDIRVGEPVAIVPNTYQPNRTDAGSKPPPFFIRPSERTLEQAKQMVIPTFTAMMICAVDPDGFERVEIGYQAGGHHFWSPKAYTAGKLVKHMRKPVMCLTVAAAMGAVVAIFMRRRL
eukprot:gnl/TRDRNA2_/TRDRNA2_196790_c0_seq1.p1 gnl/TRDRNA2_/TRDRNA2_196790_c0~~gnl/TRDRNA2_/TRDRNA2_196790_c0_seq1.p1  ORF type:complete len:289 (-),score=26.33 gnl/TRDRNA2_/TRDRNA2_196790_c0_seq1:91-885(-)